MNRDELASAIDEANRTGLDRLTLVLRGKYPRRFPRGELLCVNAKGEKVYSYPVERLERWLSS